MAKYEQYTEKQQREMSKIAARATRYKMKIDEINRKLAQPVISFEENQKLRETLKTFKDLFKQASDEIQTIANERALYLEEIELARKYLDSAAERKERWGFE